MSIIIYLDHREQSLKELLTDAHCKLLDYGDIVIDITLPSQNHRQLIFERKTLNDLAASIKDGRYHNQKTNLLASFQRTDIFYIIEGDVCFTEDHIASKRTFNGITHDIIIGSIINTIVRDGINVFNTKNINETADLINNIIRRVTKNPEKYVIQQNVQCQLPSSICKTKKTASKEECYRAQLCQIPGISEKAAAAIMYRYPSMKELMESIGFGEQAFNGIKVGGKRLSSTTISKIIDFLS